MYEQHDRDRDRDDRDIVRGESTGVSPTLIGLIVVAILAVVFIVQNQSKTEVEFLFWTLNTDVWVAIAIALALGAVLGWLALLLVRRRRR